MKGYTMFVQAMDGTPLRPAGMELRRVSLPLLGVGCPSAALGLESRLVGLSGVLSAYVNPLTQTAHLEYDARSVSEEQLARTMRAAGCTLRRRLRVEHP